jgi:hypothetical protein
MAIAALLIFISGNARAQEKKKYDFSGFSKVGVGFGMYVTVSQGSSYSVEVEGDKRDLEVLKLKQNGTSLNFGFDKSNYRKHEDIKITIKMPVLTGISLSGGAHGRINMNISSKTFEGDLSGGAELTGNLQCGNISFDGSGGCTVTLKGTGKNLSVDGSGGSVFNLKDFSVYNVDADLSGGSNVTITANGTISSEQSGGCHITYYGKAKMGHNDFSGGSGISKGN